MSSPEKIIEQTKKWINDVIIGCNFCPFAAKVVKQQQVHYEVEESSTIAICLVGFLHGLTRLDKDATIETSFIIYPNHFQLFPDYLHFVSIAENVLRQEGYEGVYQVASFHPLYQFASSELDDAANFTNRSIYPMLHILREESIEKALHHYKNPEEIPKRNIQFAHEKGLVYMKMLRDACFKV